MKILSIRAPWWWFILHAGKDIENRDRRTHYRGPLLIQASRWFLPEDVLQDGAVARWMEAKAGVTSRGTSLGELRRGRGHILGIVDLVDCVDSSSSTWFVGRYGYVLANPRSLATPIPFKGQLAMVDAPPAIVEALAHQNIDARTAA